MLHDDVEKLQKLDNTASVAFNAGNFEEAAKLWKQATSLLLQVRKQDPKELNLTHLPRLFLNRATACLQGEDYDVAISTSANILKLSLNDQRSKFGGTTLTNEQISKFKAILQAASMKKVEKTILKASKTSHIGNNNRETINILLAVKKDAERLPPQDQIIFYTTIAAHAHNCHASRVEQEALSKSKELKQALMSNAQASGEQLHLVAPRR